MRLAQRLRYQGYPQLRDVLRTDLGHGLLVAFAFRRPPRNPTDLLAHCGRVGAGSLLVTDTLHTLDPSPARILAAPAVGAVRLRLYNYSPALSRLDPSA